MSAKNCDSCAVRLATWESVDRVLACYACVPADRAGWSPLGKAVAVETMSDKMTPGPWFYWSGGVWTTPEGCEDGGACIVTRASASPIPGWEKDANLRACAAVPDLIAALRAMMTSFDDVLNDWPNDELHESPETTKDRAIAALRKAGAL